MRSRAVFHTVVMWLVVLAILASCSVLWGEIQIPAVTAPGKKIEARFVPSKLPAGAEVQGDWIVPDCETDLEAIDYIQIWAAPGRHSIEFRGAWMQFETIDVPQPDGSVKKVRSVIAWGYFWDKAEFEVTGGTNPPDPPDPVGQKWQIVMIHQAGEQLDNLPSAQRELLTSLTLRQETAAKGHKIQAILDDNVFSGVVPDKLQPFVTAARGSTLPCIVLSPVDRAAVPKVYPLPQNQAEYWKLLGGAK